MKLLKAMATIASLTMVSRVVGYLRDMVMAAVLGASPIQDAFLVALRLPNLFRRITAEGAFTVSFVPLYNEKLIKDADEANEFAGQVQTVMSVFLSAFTVLMILIMPLIIKLIAPGFEGDRFDMAVAFSRISFSYLLCMSISAFYGGVLNVHGRYAPFAIAPVLFNIFLLVALGIGALFESKTQIGYLLAIGVFCAGLGQVAFMYIAARFYKINIPMCRFVINDDIKNLFRLMLPGIMGAGIVHINLFADTIMASKLPEGAVSHLYFADRLNQLPLSTIGIAVGTALLPLLSKAISEHKKEESQNLFNRAMEACFFLGLPSAIGLMAIAPLIIGVLFERGAFTGTDTATTAHVLQAYAFGLPAYIGVKVFSTAYWAEQDTKTPVKTSIVSVVLNIIIGLSLMPFLGVAGIALATGIVGWLQLYLLWRGMRHSSYMMLDDRFMQKFVPTAGLSVFMGIVAFILGIVLQDHSIYFNLVVIMGISVAIYGGGLMLFNVYHPRDIKLLLKNKEE
jgi:putative peptidoglycan lipid II flippase